MRSQETNRARNEKSVEGATTPPTARLTTVMTPSSTALNARTSTPNCHREHGVPRPEKACDGYTLPDKPRPWHAIKLGQGSTYPARQEQASPVPPAAMFSLARPWASSGCLALATVASGVNLWRSPTMASYGRRWRVSWRSCWLQSLALAGPLEEQTPANVVGRRTPDLPPLRGIDPPRKPGILSVTAPNSALQSAKPPECEPPCTAGSALGIEMSVNTGQMKMIS